MAYTRKQIITFVSIVYLIFATALAGYASFRANSLSIPIPRVLSFFTTVLPVLAGLVLETAYDLTRRQERRERIPRGQTPRPPLIIIANTIIFIYSTVVITLLGTHAAPPSGLDCSLRNRWQRLYTTKDEEAVRVIQNAFNCCGLLNSHDRAWPFPDRSHDAYSCENAFGRTVGCIKPWKAEEQNMAGILMGVVGLVFVWQFAIIVFPQHTPWLRRALPDRVSRLFIDEEQGTTNNSRRRAIDYLPNFNRYSDRVAAEPSDSEEEEHAPERAVDEGIQHVRNALPDPSQEEERPHPAIENDWSRN
ncbi:hypothetical protein CC78DRAFT_289082 [Lojkania enalia]|uniref:Tetraspanin Tsp3 n=1 Tax=Lojkania enalia TaxID=147567 RepID=A0A9P4N2A8_9PLEO|nr:hypothetical protein CC78DRAFT_289082 [Didymosphaeria enalia]